MDSIVPPTKRFPYHKICLLLDSPLQAGQTGAHDSELSFFIITAIKFFLFQRNQIPVPFDQISRATVTVPDVDDDDLVDSGGDDDGDDKLSPSGFLTHTTQDEGVEEDGKNCKDRILYLRKQRQTKFKQKVMSKKIQKQIQDERRIRECWDPLFRILQMALTHQAHNLVAFILMFGQTIKNPRETILFQFNSSTLKSQTIVSDTQTEQVQAPVTMSSNIRKIFKSIIMSTAFPEFTSKSLQKTNTHLCILTKTPIPEVSPLLNDLVALDEFVIPGNQTINNVNVVNRTGQTGHLVKPILHINLECTKDLQSQTEDEVDFDLFNNNSFFCYQIPIQFRGIQWRKK